MGEIVILDDYKKKRLEEEIEALKRKVDEAMTNISVYPRLRTDADEYTYIPGDFIMDELTSSSAGSVDWDWLSTSISYGYYSYGEDDES